MYLHGTIGTDILWFASWTPTSLGTTIAVCVGIFTLSMLERYLASLRRMFEANWTEETSSRLAIKRRSTTHATLFSSDIELQETEKNEQQQPLDPYGPGESIDQDEGSSSQSGRKMHMKGGGRTIHIPFRLGVDLPRGLFQALQTLLAYLLMLVAMTFNVWWSMAVVVGSGVGEVFFGRLGTGIAAMTHH